MPVLQEACRTALWAIRAQRLPAASLSAEMLVLAAALATALPLDNPWGSGAVSLLAAKALAQLQRAAGEVLALQAAVWAPRAWQLLLATAPPSGPQQQQQVGTASMGIMQPAPLIDHLLHPSGRRRWWHCDACCWWACTDV